MPSGRNFPACPTWGSRRLGPGSGGVREVGGRGSGGARLCSAEIPPIPPPGPAPAPPPAPAVTPDPKPGQLQVPTLVNLVHQGVDLLRPGRIEPVRQSPRTFASGSFTHGTCPRARPCSSGVLACTDRLCPPPSPAHSAADRSVTWLSPR